MHGVTTKIEYRDVLFRLHIHIIKLGEIFFLPSLNNIFLKTKFDKKLLNSGKPSCYWKQSSLTQRGNTAVFAHIVHWYVPYCSMNNESFSSGIR